MLIAERNVLVLPVESGWYLQMGEYVANLRRCVQTSAVAHSMSIMVVYSIAVYIWGLCYRPLCALLCRRFGFPIINQILSQVTKLHASSDHDVSRLRTSEREVSQLIAHVLLVSNKLHLN